MRKYVFFAAMYTILLILSSMASAQDIDTLWTNNYSSGGFDSANCVQETSDGGFVMVGYSKESGVIETDIFLVKTDANGDEEWSANIGDEHLETGYHVLQTYDDGYLICAQSDAFGSTQGDFRIWIIRTDNTGDTLWTFPFTADDGNGFPLYAIETYDSGYAVTGVINVSHDNKAFILRLDKDGGYCWHHYYGGDAHQDGSFIAEMPGDSGFMVAGNYDFPYATSYDWWCLRTDKNGLQLWDSTYAITDYTDIAYGACMVDDGMVMVGLARNVGHAYKVDLDGHTVWSKAVSKEPYNEKNNSVCPTPDGGLMVGGWVWVAGARRDYCFIKLEADGDTLWSYTVGGFDDDHGRSLVPTTDGGFAMVGSSTSFFPEGSLYLVKIADITTDIAYEGGDDLPHGFRLSKNYPNPFNPATRFSYSLPYRTHVSLVIYNLLGQKVAVLADGIESAGVRTVEWDGRRSNGDEMPSGVYFCRMETDGFNATQKMLLIR